MAIPPSAYPKPASNDLCITYVYSEAYIQLMEEVPGVQKIIPVTRDNSTKIYGHFENVRLNNSE